MIEIHSHILPGLDDGAPDLAAAQQLARDYIAQGVSDVVCTPHLTTEHSQTPATLDWYLEKRNTAQAQLAAGTGGETAPVVDQAALAAATVRRRRALRCGG